MRTILQLLFFFSFSSISFSQVFWNEESQSAKMEGIIQIEDVQIEELYERSKVWVAANITSANKQTVSDQDSLKQLIGAGNLILSSGAGPNQTLNFNITIFIKDGRIKYIVNKLVLINYSGTLYSGGEPTFQDLDALYEKRFKKGQDKKDIQILIDEKLTSLIKTLENTLTKSSKSETEGW